MAKAPKRDFIQGFLIVRNPAPERLDKMVIVGYECSEDDAINRMEDILNEGTPTQYLGEEFYIYKLVDIMRSSIAMKIRREKVG